MQVKVTSKRDCFTNVKSNIKAPKKSHMLSEVFHEYCSNATLHGIRYMGAKNKTSFEKLWWIVVFMLSLSMCAYLITRTWIKWENNPVIVSFAQEQTSIWDIPFPAVTICPLSKINQNVYNYTNYILKSENLTGNERKFFWDISLVCSLDNYGIVQSKADKTTDEDAIQNIIDVTSNDTIGTVKWQYEHANKDNFFTRSLTEEGICFTSNSFSQNDMFTDKINHNIPFINHSDKNIGWDIENGYPPGLKVTMYPRRTAQDGYVGSLSFIMGKYLKHTDYICGTIASGYKLMLHNPAELPRTGQKFILIPLNRKVAVSVHPEVITTSTGLMSLSPETRNCYFSHEKTLHFFNIYTQNNCKMECFANMTKAKCGCVPFFLPRDNQTLICGIGLLSCIKHMRDLIQYYRVLLKENNIGKFENQNIEFQIYEKCNCLPSCSTLQYSAETSQVDAHFIKTIMASGDLRHAGKEIVEMLVNEELAFTQVDIFFKENHFIAMHRSELYGQIDFLANCGGLLGLFLGFSILSIIEIVYFVTIRIYYKIKQNKTGKINVND